jgi:hypothetical protein
MPDLVAMIEEWLVLQDNLKTVKEKEANLRRDICEIVFDGKRKTVKTEVGPYKVKAVYKINNKVDEAAYLTLKPKLTLEEQEAVKVKYDLVASKYKKLRETSLLHQCIISKPGMPTLEVNDGN